MSCALVVRSVFPRKIFRIPCELHRTLNRCNAQAHFEPRRTPHHFGRRPQSLTGCGSQTVASCRTRLGFAFPLPKILSIFEIFLLAAGSPDSRDRRPAFRIERKLFETQPPVVSRQGRGSAKKWGNNASARPRVTPSGHAN